jgi:amidase
MAQEMTMVTADLKTLYTESDALDLAALVKAQKVSPTEMVETAIALIEERDPELNAVVERTFDMARQAAINPPPGPFSGVPFLLKNLGSPWKGTPMTTGFPFLRDYRCTEDSELSRRIRAAGFLLLGRTNTPEGGWCIGCEPKMYGATKNPWNAAVTPGGSSGGAAAAVAARLLPLAEASDGGGSIRVPASCCGLVGLKLSRGRITLGPQVADAFHGGALTFCVTRTVRGTAAYLDAVAGGLPGDPYSASRPAAAWLSQIAGGPGRLRIGYTLKPAWGSALASEVRDTLLAALRLLENLGHIVEEHDLGVELKPIWDDYNVVVAGELAAEYGRFPAIVGRDIALEEYAPVNRAIIERGRALSAIDLSRAIAANRLATMRIAADLAPYDIWLTPTLTQLPRPVGYWSMDATDLDDYLDRWADAGYMAAFNVSGLPAMSLPMAVTKDNIPVGMQIVGRHGDESTLLRLAQQLETEVQWHKRRPPGY